MHVQTSDDLSTGGLQCGAGVDAEVTAQELGGTPPDGPAVFEDFAGVCDSDIESEFELRLIVEYDPVLRDEFPASDIGTGIGSDAVVFCLGASKSLSMGCHG